MLDFFPFHHSKYWEGESSLSGSLHTEVTEEENESFFCSCFLDTVKLTSLFSHMQQQHTAELICYQLRCSCFILNLHIYQTV